jgi:DNA (cytosine-5)-methyltransferase 1
MILKVFETFSGIGAQHKALTNLENKGFNIKKDIIAICDWDIHANRSYRLIHNNLKNNININEEIVNSFINKVTLSNDGKKPLKKESYLLKRNKEKIVFEFLINNNLCDITNIKDRYKSIKNYRNINLLTYSFPCQDLSMAGNLHGYNKGVVEGTRSGLLLEIERLILSLEDSELPRYLLMENVSNLVSKKHYKSFEDWIEKLKSIGYSTYWGVIDSHKYGTLQQRKRVFALSVKEKDPLDAQIYQNLDKIVKEVYDKNIDKFPKEEIEDIFDFDNRFINESLEALIKDTPSRISIINNNKRITKQTKVIPTVTTKQDRNPNTGCIKTNLYKEGYTEYRFITPREAYKLMGFEDKDYEIVSQVTKKDIIYKQAGNSIVVRVLELIFLTISEEFN